MRYCLEWGAIVAVAFLVLGKGDLQEAIATVPFPTLFLPAWGVVAYLSVTFRRPKQERRAAHLGVWRLALAR